MKKLALSAFLIGATILSTQAKDLFINNQTYEVDTLVYKHAVGPGTTYAYYRVPARPLDIFVLEMDLTNPHLQIEVVNGGQRGPAVERPSAFYKRYQDNNIDVFAAHNGDFYSTINGEAGISRMGLIGASDCLFNPTGTALFVIDGNNTPFCARTAFSGTVSTADKSTRLHTVNQLRLEWESATYANQLSLYTPEFGPNMHAVSTGGTVVTIAPADGSLRFPTNTPLRFKVLDVQQNTGQMPIPADGAVLHGVGDSATFLSQLSTDDEIVINLGVSLGGFPDVKNIREAIGGSDHIILKDGQITNINNPDLHPRTFMGHNADRTMVYSVVVDGRSGASAGINLDDEGRVLQWLGASDGINLDGGGSTCMVVNEVIRNHNSDGTERAVGNGVVFYSTAPHDNDITQIGFEPRAYFVPITARFRPYIYAYNQYGLLLTSDLKDVTITCDPEIGFINDEGIFVASKTPTQGYIYASYNGITARQQVTTTLSSLKLDYENYIVDNRGDYPIIMSAPVNRFTYQVDAGSVDWLVSDNNVCSISNGKVRGINNGTTTITGTSDNFIGTVTITTENVDTDLRNLFLPFNPDNWTVSQSGGKNMKLTPNQDGFDMTYIGTGANRAPVITLKNKTDEFKTYGLPKAIEMDINPGQVEIKRIDLSWADAHGDHAVAQILEDTLPFNTLSNIVIDLASLTNIADNSVFPITFSSLKFTVGNSEKDQEFTISIPRLQYNYADATHGVQDIATDATAQRLILMPSVAHAGETVTLNTPDNATIYTIGGAQVAHSSNGVIDTTGMERGLYIVSALGKSAKLIIK